MSHDFNELYQRFYKTYRKTYSDVSGQVVEQNVIEEWNRAKKLYKDKSERAEIIEQRIKKLESLRARQCITYYYKISDSASAECEQKPQKKEMNFDKEVNENDSIVTIKSEQNDQSNDEISLNKESKIPTAVIVPKREYDTPAQDKQQAKICELESRLNVQIELKESGVNDSHCDRQIKEQLKKETRILSKQRSNAKNQKNIGKKFKKYWQQEKKWDISNSEKPKETPIKFQHHLE